MTMKKLRNNIFLLALLCLKVSKGDELDPPISTLNRDTWIDESAETKSFEDEGFILLVDAPTSRKIMILDFSITPNFFDKFEVACLSFTISRDVTQQASTLNLKHFESELLTTKPLTWENTYDLVETGTYSSSFEVDAASQFSFSSLSLSLSPHLLSLRYI
jgi:hypothetical protein